MPPNDSVPRSASPIPWLALCIALSPVIADALRLAADAWWARGTVVIAALAIHAMVRTPDTETPGGRPLAGALLVAFALAAMLVAAGGGMIRFARPALPIAAIGMAMVQGRPEIRRAALLCFAVAPPRALMDALPGLHDAVPDTAGLAIASPDGGLPLAWLLAGLGAIAAVHRGVPASRVVKDALRCALLALPIQAAALLAAIGLAHLSHADAGRVLLSHGVWTASAALLWLRIRPGRTTASDL